MDGSLAHYIDKYNAYSDWEARVILFGDETELKPSLFGSQAQRRRWLKRDFLQLPGASLYQFFFATL